MGPSLVERELIGTFILVTFAQSNSSAFQRLRAEDCLDSCNIIILEFECRTDCLGRAALVGLDRVLILTPLLSRVVVDNVELGVFFNYWRKSVEGFK